MQQLDLRAETTRVNEAPERRPRLSGAASKAFWRSRTARALPTDGRKTRMTRLKTACVSKRGSCHKITAHAVSPRPAAPGAFAYVPLLAAKVVNETEDDDGTLKLILYGNPTRPGYCRLIGRQVRKGRGAGGGREGTRPMQAPAASKH